MNLSNYEEIIALYAGIMVAVSCFDSAKLQFVKQVDIITRKINLSVEESVENASTLITEIENTIDLLDQSQVKIKQKKLLLFFNTSDSYTSYRRNKLFKLKWKLKARKQQFEELSRMFNIELEMQILNQRIIILSSNCFLYYFTLSLINVLISEHVVSSINAEKYIIWLTVLYFFYFFIQINKFSSISYFFMEVRNAKTRKDEEEFIVYNHYRISNLFMPMVTMALLSLLAFVSRNKVMSFYTPYPETTKNATINSFFDWNTRYREPMRHYLMALYNSTSSLIEHFITFLDRYYWPVFILAIFWYSIFLFFRRTLVIYYVIIPFFLWYYRSKLRHDAASIAVIKRNMSTC